MHLLKKKKKKRCINCGKGHLATSSECAHIEQYKRATALAATDNIPIYEAMQRISCNSSYRSSDNHVSSPNSGYDFWNFPMLRSKPQLSHQTVGSGVWRGGSAASNSTHGANRFSLLEQEVSQDAPAGHRTYAQAAAAADNVSPEKVRNHNPKIRLVNVSASSMTSDNNRDKSQQEAYKPQKESFIRSPLFESHRKELLYPDGRPTEGKANGAAYTFAQTHDYAMPKDTDKKNFGKAILAFILSDTLPCLARGDIAGAISSLCSFMLKFFMESSYMAGSDDRPQASYTAEPHRSGYSGHSSPYSENIV